MRIHMTTNEFEKTVKDIFGEDTEVEMTECDFDICAEEPLTNDEIIAGLEKHLNFNITNITVDNGVWISNDTDISEMMDYILNL